MGDSAVAREVNEILGPIQEEVEMEMEDDELLRPHLLEDVQTPQQKEALWALALSASGPIQEPRLAAQTTEDLSPLGRSADAVAASASMAMVVAEAIASIGGGAVGEAAPSARGLVGSVKGSSLSSPISSSWPSAAPSVMGPECE